MRTCPTQRSLHPDSVMPSLPLAKREIGVKMSWQNEWMSRRTTSAISSAESGCRPLMWRYAWPRCLGCLLIASFLIPLPWRQIDRFLIVSVHFFLDFPPKCAFPFWRCSRLRTASAPERNRCQDVTTSPSAEPSSSPPMAAGEIRQISRLDLPPTTTSQPRPTGNIRFPVQPPCWRVFQTSPKRRHRATANRNVGPDSL